MEEQRVKHTLCKPLLKYTLFLSIYCCLMYCVTSCTVKTCDEIGTFQQMFGISLPTCAEKCFRRHRCRVFMFHFGMQHCALKDDIDVQSLGEEGPVCRYYTRDDWSQIDLGPCNGHTCSEIERCIGKKNNEFDCVKSECPSPDEIANATLLSNSHSIGSTNRYKCIKGFVGQGTPTITCGDDAAWSETDFRCDRRLESCPSPLTQYFNADLTDVDGNLYHPGTNLTFTCREDYRTIGDEWTSTCQASLLWYPSYIGCCNENTTDLDHGGCYAIINAGKATTKDGAEDYCSNIGGHLSWTYPLMKNWYDRSTTDWALQDVTLPWLDEYWNYTSCATANNAQGDDSQTLQKKLADVKDNNWVGDDCSWGYIWAPGQPAGNVNCLVIDLRDSTTDGVQEFACHFDPLTDRVGFACRFDTPML